MAGVTIRKSGMKAFMNKDMRRFAARIARRVTAEIRIRAPHFTGRLNASIHASRIKVRRYDISFTVEAKTGYSLYPEKGTGIYVGRGYIYPKRARALVFRGRGGSKLIFAKRVKGQPGQHFMRDGLYAAIGSL